MPKLAQQARTFETTIQRTARLEYLLYLPPEYTKSKKRWPLMLFLHGAGERGNNLELVKIHGPPKHIEAGQHYPMIVVSPQCPEGTWWDVHALIALLDELERTLRVDPDRIMVTGLSMGGYGTWALALEQPERFAAIAPVCGGGLALHANRLLTHLPAWVFHGALDPLVPLEEGERMVKALRAGGNKRVKFTVYKNVGHDSWERAYANPKLYAWMLEQRRAQPSKG